MCEKYKDRLNTMSNNLSKDQIKELLPHREPMLLLDELINIKKLHSATAIVNVTKESFFVQGHFPGQPVMPGVLSLEIMAQAGSFLMLSQVEDPLSTNMFFSAVEKTKFRRPIVPGDQLMVHMTLVRRKLNLCKFHGVCKVDDKIVAEAFFSANLVNRARE